jgi:uncharacterized protein YxjI
LKINRNLVNIYYQQKGNNTMKCLKCGYENEQNAEYCNLCKEKIEKRIFSVDEFAERIKRKNPKYKNVENSVLVDKIIEKYPQYRDQISLTATVSDKNHTDTDNSPKNITEDGLMNAQYLVINQKKELGEILTGFETRNRFVVNAVGSSDIYEVLEQGSGIGSFLIRQLGPCRPYRVAFMNNGIPFMNISRNFTLIFSKVKVTDSYGRELGIIRRRFSILNRIYTITDQTGQDIATIKSPLFRVWTYKIYDALNNEVGVIKKKWSGLGTEFFTDADNFAVELAKIPKNDNLRRFLLAAAIVIDYDSFERTKS